MTHVRQGRGECFIATISTLSGKSVASIKRALKKEWNCNYQDILRGYARVPYRPGSRLKVRASVPWHAITEWLCNTYLPTFPGLAQYSRAQYAYPIISLFPFERFVGRGVLVSWKNDKNTGHIAAFEDGLVYDSNYAAPMSPDKFVALYKTAFLAIVHEEVQ